MHFWCGIWYINGPASEHSRTSCVVAREPSELGTRNIHHACNGHIWERSQNRLHGIRPGCVRNERGIWRHGLNTDVMVSTGELRRCLSMQSPGGASNSPYFDGTRKNVNNMFDPYDRNPPRMSTIERRGPSRVLGDDNIKVIASRWRRGTTRTWTRVYIRNTTYILRQRKRGPC